MNLSILFIVYWCTNCYYLCKNSAYASYALVSIFAYTWGYVCTWKNYRP